MPQSFIKFYGNDWRSDPRLRLCSAAARGVWIDLISIMMEAEPFGHLVVNGKAPSAKTVGALTVTPVKVVDAALAELEEQGVFSRTDDGTIYSRRMVRQNEKSEQGRELVEKRWAKHGARNTAGASPRNTNAEIVRSQKPEASKGPLPHSGTNGHAKPDEPQEVVDAFFAIREVVFGTPAPHGISPLEHSIAAGWLEDGASFYPVRDLFEKRMRAMQTKGKQAPGGLKYLDDAVREAMAQNFPGYSP